MGKVTTGEGVSVDGFIAGPNEPGFDQLFALYGACARESPSTHPEIQITHLGCQVRRA